MSDYLLTGVLCIVNGVSVTYNAALKKTAYQSSVFGNADASYPASLANDGDRSSKSPQCAISARQRNPWWAVDLGGPVTVARVDLINTADEKTGATALSRSLCTPVADQTF